ncbi:MAG: molybdopterin synthase [Phycisphaerales bacterium]|nr:molybdopterin synthase [Phycisphaerales bacterium]
MAVRVVYLGPARDWAGVHDERVPVDAPVRLAELAARLCVGHPKLGDARKSLRFAINGRFADESEMVEPGDEVGVIPPVSGGADADFAALQHEAIDVSAVRGHVQSAGACGGIVVFEGVTRREVHPRHGSLVRLSYEAYAEMAVSEMQRLIATVRQRWTVERVALVHRVGNVGIGETSVVVAVGAGHRGPAFEACRWLIDALKRDVPIWKEEVWDDGASSWSDPAKHGG